MFIVFVEIREFQTGTCCQWRERVRQEVDARTGIRLFSRWSENANWGDFRQQGIRTLWDMVVVWLVVLVVRRKHTDLGVCSRR
jgi:hypothetical protein